MAVSIKNLEQFIAKDIKVVTLTEDCVFKPFDCGNDDLNDFLLSDAKIYLKHLRYTTTLLSADNQIVAYYSLANDLLAIRDYEDFVEEMNNDKNTKIKPSFRERFFNQNTYPAVKIGRLAVDKDFQGNGIGTFIIKSLLNSFRYRNKTGCQFITVDAINTAKAFLNLFYV